MNPQAILQAMQQGAVLITANKRLARQWRQAFDQAQAASAQVWPAAAIFPWSAWLHHLWQQCTWLEENAPTLLNPLQEQAIWQGIIAASSVKIESPLALRPLAKLAAEAWELVHAWRLEHSLTSAADSTQDVQHFMAWANDFASQCQKKSWLSGAQVPKMLAERLPACRHVLPERLLLVGFDELTPQQMFVCESLQQCGVVVEMIPLERSAARSASRLALADARREDEACARWARAVLDVHPNWRIGIVAPDLAARRQRLARLLDAQLQPEALLPAAVSERRAWNMSLGTALLDFPLVQASLRLLALDPQCVMMEEISGLLLSPFVRGVAAERQARAMLDARLRAQGHAYLSLAALISHAEHNACAEFARVLRSVHSRRKTAPAKQLPSAWLADVLATLQDAGWAQEELHSADFQLRTAWLDALHSLNTLDDVLGEVPRASALDWMRQIAAQTLFQPEADAAAPVQVCGVIEALGQQFDAVWLLGMHEAAWPEMARPHPLLPIHLQVKHDMPHASPAREIAYAQRISEVLLALGQSSPTIVSYPMQDGEMDLAISPLFAQLPVITLEQIKQSTLPMPLHWVDRVCGMEQLDDTCAPAVRTSRVRGGARVLELQSDCPFRAFAELRLSADVPEDTEFAADERQRGSLLHRSMERLWQGLQTQAQLLALSEQALRQQVYTAVQQAMTEAAQARPSLWPRRLQDTEIERLTALVLAWLAIETTRPSFCVADTEKKQAIEVGRLELEVKIDRIDRLADGSLMVLDYKTGAVSTSMWADEQGRPPAPQLPLYAAYLAQVSAMAFAQVRTGDVKLVGHAATDKAGLQIQPDWPERLNDYRQTLDKLAEQFAQGYAAVDPRKADVCRRCAQSLLCRVHEARGEGFGLLMDEA